MSQSNPFIDVEGVYNFRDVAAHSSHPALRTGFIFRSAQPYGATASGAQQMRVLGITTIFDLRADAEVEETAKLTPLREIEGLNRVSAPVFGSSEKNVASKLMGYFSNDTPALMTIYARMLAEGSDCFRRIFCHVRDNAREPCIVHCALGKDRTGIAMALILSLAGVPAHQIAEEYALSNMGLEPYKPVVRKLLESASKLDWDESKVTAMLSVREPTMHAVLEWLEIQYGGVEGYLRDQCRFSGQDLERIKENLRTPQTQATPVPGSVSMGFASEDH